MKHQRHLLTALLVVGALALVAWFVRNSSWPEVEETDPPHGEAAKPYYSLRKIAAAAGTTVVERSALETLPPQDATLFLESRFWDLFPARDARLRAWVEGGGRLVVFAARVPEQRLRWVPPTFARFHAQKPVKGAASAASSADDADDDEDDDARPAGPTGKPSARAAAAPLPGGPTEAREICETFVEGAGSPPAFEPGRAYRRCLKPRQYRACVDEQLRRTPHANPTWALGNDDRTFAMRVAVGRGSVTSLAECLPVNNDVVALGDHALIDAAVLGMKPGATLWIVDDEAGEPLPLWLWHHARAPLLLAVVATVLALWRLMVRFGPRFAPPAPGRRSMGEQVRGTGEFLAANDPQALHAATLEALDDAARARIEDYGGLAGDERVRAIAAALAPGVALDVVALKAALRLGPASKPAQWLEAIEHLEQARRALLRSHAAPRD